MCSLHRGALNVRLPRLIPLVSSVRPPPPTCTVPSTMSLLHLEHFMGASSYAERTSDGGHGARRLQRRRDAAVPCSALGAPDMGVNGWGESPLCVNTVAKPFITGGRVIETLDPSNCGIARFRGREATGHSG